LEDGKTPSTLLAGRWATTGVVLSAYFTFTTSSGFQVWS
jgi:hypothetical protein